MTFNVGDRVVYDGNDRSVAPFIAEGSIGTVTMVDRGAFYNDEDADIVEVTFDEEPGYGLTDIPQDVLASTLTLLED